MEIIVIKLSILFSFFHIALLKSQHPIPSFCSRSIHSRTEELGFALAVGEMRCGFPQRCG